MTISTMMRMTMLTRVTTTEATKIRNPFTGMHWWLKWLTVNLHLWHDGLNKLLHHSKTYRSPVPTSPPLHASCVVVILGIGCRYQYVGMLAADLSLKIKHRVKGNLNMTAIVSKYISKLLSGIHNTFSLSWQTHVIHHSTFIDGESLYELTIYTNNLY